MIRSYLWFAVAALGEIGGCYAFWLWIRQGRSPSWALAGLLLLAGFALALTRVDSEHAGRAFAAYGGLYILAALLWLWLVEGRAPDRFDLLGVGLCLLGSAIILLAPRARP